MHEVIKMWMGILEDEDLSEDIEYYDYGVEYLRNVAVKYGFDNPQH